MKKWFFSNNGEVTAPLDLDEAKDYLATNPNVYGWHPSFTQWKPVNCISEFVDVLPPTVQAPAIPKKTEIKRKSGKPKSGNKAEKRKTEKRGMFGRDEIRMNPLST